MQYLLSLSPSNVAKRIARLLECSLRLFSVVNTSFVSWPPFFCLQESNLTRGLVLGLEHNDIHHLPVSCPSFSGERLLHQLYVQM